MKKLITQAAAIAVLSTGAILAQGPLDQGFGFGGAPPTNANPPDVATVVAREVAFLTKLLTLTSGQQTQATTIITNELNAITPIQTTIGTAQTALTTAIKANDTKGIATQSAAIGTAQGQILALEANADAAFYALLTTAQQTTLNNVGDAFLGLGLGGLHIPGGGH